MALTAIQELIANTSPEFRQVFIINAADATVPPTQATAMANAPCGPGINVVKVSASADDAVALPPCRQGMVVVVHNDAAVNAIEVWPFTGDSIDGGTVNAKDSGAIAAGAARMFVGDKTGSNWEAVDADF